MIHVCRNKPDNLVMDNNAAFEFTIPDCDDIEKKIINLIDKGTLISKDYFLDRFGAKTDVRFLSTGSKTLLNIYKNPSKIFFCGELGDNAVRSLPIIAECTIYVRNSELLNPIDDSIDFI